MTNCIPHTYSSLSGISFPAFFFLSNIREFLLKQHPEKSSTQFRLLSWFADAFSLERVPSRPLDHCLQMPGMKDGCYSHQLLASSLLLQTVSAVIAGAGEQWLVG